MENHNPLRPPIDKPPFWKQPLTPQLVIWVAVHVVLTLALTMFMQAELMSDGKLDPKSTKEFSLLLLACFSLVTFILALLKKATEWMLRVSSRSGR